MIDIELRHNPYANESEVFFNGRLYAAGESSKYATRPFVEWADKIMKCFSLEANDDYSLTYVGTEAYAHILHYHYHAEKLNSGQNFEYKPHMLKESVHNRLNKLNMLCANGLRISRFSMPVSIYTDMDKKTIEHYFPKPIGLTFCRMTLKFHPLSELDNETGSQSDIPCFVISENTMTLPNRKAEIFYFLISDDRKCGGLRNGVYREKCDLQSLGKLVESYMEIGILTPILREALANTDLDKTAAVYRAVYMLDKVEPKVFFEVPRNIELGKTAEIKSITLPEYVAPYEVGYITQNQSVIQMNDATIETVGTGDTFIEAIYDGKLLERLGVSVFKRIRAKAIDLFPREAVMDTGSKLKLQLQCEPQNADNLPLAKISVNSGAVSVIQISDDYFEVTAIKAGQAQLTVDLEDLQTRCFIKVHQKLEGLDVQLSKSSFAVGDVSRVSIQTIPSEAICEKFEVSVSPASVARYDYGTATLVGTGKGSGQVTVADTERDIRTSVKFYVN